ncbi:hypothetical protein NRIC_22660 [Enterococcus florum]|uniref:HTH LytTR-type domain-containing protein n=1 Tax=Enterococcus florum TaxID=2480627 RepID=A0A4P5P8L1_9ENTE|nr:LytTR family DNA-binding domain-containing protein [Enterococcus florum]GCF94375.1 hypothetical protein NRIC_22660 [Enterococcus florum]
MIFNYIWQQEKAVNEIDVISHPFNREKLKQLEQTLQHSTTISVIDPKNNRTKLLAVPLIETITAMGHQSKICTTAGERFFLSKKLKELGDLEQQQLFRINNSTILNLTHAASFAAGQHARLEVQTKTGNTYIVSRHYAKQIKERFR